MKFYGISYLQAQSGLNDYLKYIFIFSLLFILVVVFSMYMRHRLQTKYRDLTIIALLFLLLTSGVQYTEYTNSQNSHSKSSQMVNFVNVLAENKGVSINDIYANSTQLSDGVIVKIDERYFVVNLSTDQRIFNLTQVWLTDPSIQIIKD